MQLTKKIKEVFDYYGNGWIVNLDWLPPFINYSEDFAKFSQLEKKMVYPKKGDKNYQPSVRLGCFLDIKEKGGSYSNSKVLYKDMPLPIKVNDENYGLLSSRNVLLGIEGHNITEEELKDAEKAFKFFKRLCKYPMLTDLLYRICIRSINKKRSEKKMLIVKHLADSPDSRNTKTALTYVHFNFKSQEELKQQFLEFAKKTFAEADSKVYMCELYMNVDPDKVDPNSLYELGCSTFTTSIYHNDAVI